MSYKIAFSKMRFETKIADGDWDTWTKYTGSFENLELDPVGIMDKIYMGHPFCTWHKNKWRKGENYLLGQHLCLDFDTEDERSTLTTLAKDVFIQKYAFLIYTSPSHKPEAPRSRVVFLLDTPIQQAKNYTAAAAALFFMYGSADSNGKDACRPWYGSVNCDMDVIGKELPLDKVKEIIAQYKIYGDLTKKNVSRSFTPSADQTEVSSALSKIPAWGIDYNEWVKVLMGIHSAFGDQGLPLAESWAEGKDKEVQDRWRSFRSQGNGSGKVTINTVFKMAIDRGWQKGVSL
jgi:hypothetical protein